MGKLTLKKLRKQTSVLRKQVKSEKSKSDKEAEKRKLRKELFRLKHRRGIGVGKSVWGGLKSGMSGAAAIRTVLRRGAIAVPIKKLKIKKKKHKKRKKRRTVKKIIVYR